MYNMFTGLMREQRNSVENRIDTAVSVFQTKADRQDNAEVEIARCTRGQYFGELALVTNKPRAASAYAVGDVKCLGKRL